MIDDDSRIYPSDNRTGKVGERECSDELDRFIRRHLQ
jgi:hypothetical protein